MQRRSFIQWIGATGLTAALGPVSAATNAPTMRFLRPPGALAENDFLARCIRCGNCGEVCPNRCISFFQTENGLPSMGTPYIIPREQACILCMKCGVACPTGALTPIEPTAEQIMKKVRMGIARVYDPVPVTQNGPLPR